MKILRIDHVVLRARDVEAMTAFYCDVLGCTVERRNEKFGLVHLRAGDALIDLVPAAGPPPSEEERDRGRNVEHVCLRVEPGDAGELRAWLGRFGIDAGEVHQHFGAEGTGPSLYIRDPEGNTIELKGPSAR